jgi:hypothetical protein
MALIVLEGLDRTGKSTLAAQLAERLGCPILHKGPPTAADPFTEYLAPLAGYRPRAGLNLILDRSFWGELVWPGVYGRETIMSLSAFEYIDDVFAGLGAVTALCHSDLDGVWGRILEAERSGKDEPLARMEGGRSLLDVARLNYLTAKKLTHMPVFEYDQSGESSTAGRAAGEGTLDWIAQFAFEAEAGA